MFDKTLIVIDLQRDYFPGGKFPLPDIERAAARAAELIDLFRRHGLPVVHVRHLEKDPTVGFLLPISNSMAPRFPLARCTAPSWARWPRLMATCWT